MLNYQEITHPGANTLKTQTNTVLIIILVCIFLSMILCAYLLFSPAIPRYFTDSELEKAAKEQISVSIAGSPDNVTVSEIRNSGKKLLGN